MPPPHEHDPSAEQLSASRGSQVWHAPPATPQLVNDVAKHAVPKQQPVGHEVPSHTQAPPTHRWPAAHPSSQVEGPVSGAPPASSPGAGSPSFQHAPEAQK